jgi:hypothetical protein
MSFTAEMMWHTGNRLKLVIFLEIRAKLLLHPHFSLDPSKSIHSFPACLLCQKLIGQEDERMLKEYISSIIKRANFMPWVDEF